MTLFALNSPLALSSSAQQGTRASLSAPSAKNNLINQQTEIHELKLGESIEKELAQDKTHSYRLTLIAGDYLRIIAEQKNLDVAVTAIGPDGKKIIQVDNTPANQKENIYLIGEAAGEYILKIERQDKDAVSGRYQISIEEWRPATQKDRDRFAAQLAFMEGNEVGGQGFGTADALKKGIEKFLQALSLWRALEDPMEEAATLNQIGVYYFTLSEPQQALKYHTMALPLRRATNDRDGESITLNNIGTVYLSLGEWQKALEYYEQALILKRSIGDRKSEANTLYHIATVYSRSGELQKSLEYYERALPLARATGERRGEALILAGIGSNSYVSGNWQKSAEYNRQALEIIRELGDRRNESLILNSLGTTYSQLGEIQSALEYFNQSLSLRREFGDKRGQAFSHLSMGGACLALGEYQKALDHYQEGLQLMRAIGDKYGEAYILSNIGLAYLRSERLDKAKDYFEQALQLSQVVGDKAGDAFARRNLGVTYLKRKDFEKANEYLSAALEMYRALGDRSREAGTLSDLARIDLTQKNLAQALSKIESSLAIAESTRQTITSQSLRESFMTTKRNLYESYIDTLMQMHKENPTQGNDSLALQVSERTRARSLLDMLIESRADIRQGVDPALLEKERKVQQQLNTKSENLTKILSSKHTEDQERTARREVEALVTEYREVQAQLRDKSPRYAALTQPQPLSTAEIQREVLDDDTLLLEYVLGEEHSYLWAVTTTTINSFELPGRAEVTEAAQRVYKLLVSKADELYPEALARLSEIILKPASQLLGRKRLIIVSDGALQYIPFGALPEPERPSEMSRETIAPLILSHEIVSAPSASTVALLRRELSHRTQAPKTLAVFADPVFAKDDQRVKSSTRSNARKVQSIQPDAIKKTKLPSDVERSIRESGLNSFERLSLSRREAEQITSLASPGQPLKALDFAASRMTATNSALADYRIVHFATHSLLNNQHPELSGIVLSLVDKKGEPQDGFLRLHEIYNLKLNADLVVLSACQTALGKEIKGEGLVGLSRGFMYAGVPRVVASLWKVSDKATSELMKRFYQEMLKGGMKPSAALRAAQVSMLKEAPWRPAYYWAGFVLQGEWQ